MLRAVRHKDEHYFVDEKGRKQGESTMFYDNGNVCIRCFYIDGQFQGEYKSWYENGQIYLHCVAVKGRCHGEYKKWKENGDIEQHCFIARSTEYSFEEIPYPTTPEELMLFKLKYDFYLLPVESEC